MKWDEEGIAIYFFQRGEIPDDITSGAPNPDLWGLPSARYGAGACDPSTMFGDQTIVFGTSSFSFPFFRLFPRSDSFLSRRHHHRRRLGWLSDVQRDGLHRRLADGGDGPDDVHRSGVRGQLRQGLQQGLRRSKTSMMGRSLVL